MKSIWVNSFRQGMINVKECAVTMREGAAGVVLLPDISAILHLRDPACINLQVEIIFRNLPGED